MAGLWAWQAGPWQTGPSIPLSAARGRSATWRRKGRHEAKFSIPLVDPGRDADQEARDALYASIQLLTSIRPFATDLWITRQSEDGAMQWLPRQRIVPYSRNLAPGVIPTTYSAGCYRKLLEQRFVRTGKTTTWSGTSPINSAWTVLSEEQTRAGSNLGIVRGLAPAMATVASSSVGLDAPVATGIDDLCALGAGADWDITSTGPLDLRLDMWTPDRGAAKGIVLDLGGTMNDGDEQLDASNYRNALKVFGQTPDGGVEPGPAYVEASDLASRPEGRWEGNETTEQTSTAGVASAAARLLVEKQDIIPGYTARLKRGFWQGPDHLWLGDRFTYVAALGPFRTAETWTVEEITADFPDDSDEEPDVSVVFGIPPRNDRTRALEVNRRLGFVERHI